MSELTLVENQVRTVKATVYVTKGYAVESEVPEGMTTKSQAERWIRDSICCGDTDLEERKCAGVSSVSVEVLLPTQGEQGAEGGL